MKTQLLKISKNQLVNVESDTQYVLMPENHFSDESYEVEFLFSKPDVKAEIMLPYFLPKNGKLNLTTVAHHKSPQTSCITKVRGVLGDKSISNFVGKIVIDRGAQQTSSFLEDDVLVVGKSTKNNSQPILTIEADDVKASHGATTGRISESDTYYLMARGLNRDDAEKLITRGFMDKMLNEILDETVRNEVSLSLEKTNE